MVNPDDIAFLRATPVLRSGDYIRSRAYYRDILGFQVMEEGGDPPRFGIFERGRSIIFVSAWHGPPNPVPNIWDVYVKVNSLNALHAELQHAGARITRPIEATVYGMREFEVTDPDGNVLCFGEDTDPTATP